MNAFVNIETGHGRRKGEMIVAPYRKSNGDVWARVSIKGEEFDVIEVMGVWMTDETWKSTQEAMKLLR